MTWGLEGIDAADLAAMFGHAFLWSAVGYLAGFWLLSMRRLTDAL
jgi:hypothetical protein